MNRCNNLSARKPRWAALALGLLGAMLSGMALAEEGLRQFPKHALRGYLVVTTAPQVQLDGKEDRMSPGARIRNTQNTIVMPAALRGQALVVNYVREMNGLIHEVWILTPREAEEQRAGAGTIFNFKFESELKPAPAKTKP
jgi:hypothetical protein